MSQSVTELLEQAKEMTDREKRHPTPHQKEILANLLISLCDLAIKQPKKK